jgi:hypothetical protein
MFLCHRVHPLHVTSVSKAQSPAPRQS